MKPGASIVTQAILPGMFKRESIEVLPIGYQAVSHWKDASYRPGVSSLPGRVGQATVTYEREELPEEGERLPGLAGGR